MEVIGPAAEAAFSWRYFPPLLILASATFVAVAVLPSKCAQKKVGMP